MPERTYLPYDKKVSEVISYFKDFYKDFNVEKAYKLLDELGITNNPNPRIAIQNRNKLFPCDFISYFNNFPNIV